MLILVPAPIIAEYWDLITDTIMWLIGIQQQSGNWPSKASRDIYNVPDPDEGDQLVQ